MYAFLFDAVRPLKAQLASSGGQLSSVHTLVTSIRDAGLNVNSIEDIGPRELSFASNSN